MKIHGVNIGTVSSIKLVNGRAADPPDDQEERDDPGRVQGVIRPKTLFGEKFVDIDPGPTEASGPFLKDGGVDHSTPSAASNSSGC